MCRETLAKSKATNERKKPQPLRALQPKQLLLLVQATNGDVPYLLYPSSNSQQLSLAYHYQKRSGSSHHGSAETNLTSIHEDAVGLCVPLSGLRIQRCHELGYKLQMRLESGIAVGQASGHTSDSTPSLGTPICRGAALKRQKKEKRKEKGVFKKLKPKVFRAGNSSFSLVLVAISPAI